MVLGKKLVRLLIAIPCHGVVSLCVVSRLYENQIAQKYLHL